MKKILAVLMAVFVSVMPMATHAAQIGPYGEEILWINNQTPNPVSPGGTATFTLGTSGVYAWTGWLDSSEPTITIVNSTGTIQNNTGTIEIKTTTATPVGNHTLTLNFGSQGISKDLIIVVGTAVVNNPSASNNVDDSSNSDESSSGGEGGAANTTSTVNTSGNVSSNGAVSPTVIQSEANRALRGAGNTAALRTKNADSISASTLRSLANAASNAGKDIVIHADTTGTDGKIQGRLYVDPSKLTGLTGDLKLGVYTGHAETKATANLFDKWFDNNLAVVKCEQKGSYGANLKIAAKVDLSKLDVKSLLFYSFDPKTNSYTEITDTNYFIDRNGFLHFTTSVGNNIIITDKLFARK